MKEDVLYVYTDASCDSRPDTDTGVIAFSVWDSDDCCLGRYAMVYDGYCDSTSCHQPPRLKTSRLGSEESSWCLA